jgi:hypothetical protein
METANQRGSRDGRAFLVFFFKNFVKLIFYWIAILAFTKIELTNQRGSRDGRAILEWFLKKSFPKMFLLVHFSPRITRIHN